MRTSLGIGVLLIVIGLAVLVWPVFSYTDRDTVIDAGPLQVTTEDTEHVRVPPILGGATILVGAAIAALGKK